MRKKFSEKVFSTFKPILFETDLFVSIKIVFRVENGDRKKSAISKFFTDYGFCVSQNLYIETFTFYSKRKLESLK